MKLCIELPRRGVDDYGSGDYGARRSGGRTHNGVDYAALPGSILLSPIVGTVTKHGYCYSDDFSFRYVEITTQSGQRHRFFYVIPIIDEGKHVYKNAPIGRVDDLRRRYPADDIHCKPITNHVHYEIIDQHGDFINPDGA